MSFRSVFLSSVVRGSINLSSRDGVVSSLPVIHSTLADAGRNSVRVARMGNANPLS